MITKMLLGTLVMTSGLAATQENVPSSKQVIVYREAGRFGGWPANHGIWIWGQEIVVGFSRGYYKDLGPERHNIDREKPEEHLLARSLDGGETWTIENPAEKGTLLPQGAMLHGKELPGVPIPEASDCPGGIDFTHPDFAMTVRMSAVDKGPSRFYYSYDRAKTWRGPYKLPLFDQQGIAGRTDYVVYDSHTCLLVLTAAKSNGEEGRPLCVRTTDGGKTWAFVSWIGPEPSGYAIMPSTVRLSGSGLLTAIRRRDGEPSWLDIYRSDDTGKTWTYLNRPAELGEGNPAAMIRLQDGRIALTYGVRMKPYGIRARLSRDAGTTWGPELTLRDDGAGRDLGYPRTVQRPDGKIVTVYYFQDNLSPERYIAATIWDAPK